eukprot:TRINITY_DN14_c0_g1_i1.p1 TRINITY_DN14_c0_g1~~TRINITY_DN14_c0_g1_i1.p1  ORF type:complete len:158 (+),score=51.31 TRINITY_DN14_c0_g1_i1:45-476(+)
MKAARRYLATTLKFPFLFSYNQGTKIIQGIARGTASGWATASEKSTDPAMKALEHNAGVLAQRRVALLEEGVQYGKNYWRRFGTGELPVSEMGRNTGYFAVAALFWVPLGYAVGTLLPHMNFGQARDREAATAADETGRLSRF